MGGVYEKISGEESTTESTAPCKAGPLDHQGEKLKEGGKNWSEEEEMMKMEIMLGMTQEEEIPCFLCLLPRCYLSHYNRFD